MNRLTLVLLLTTTLCGHTHTAAAVTCDFTINVAEHESQFTTGVQTLLDSSSSLEQETMCVEPGTYTGCGSRITLTNSVGTPLAMLTGIGESVGSVSVTCNSGEFLFEAAGPGFTWQNMTINNGQDTLSYGEASVTLRNMHFHLISTPIFVGEIGNTFTYIDNCLFTSNGLASMAGGSISVGSGATDTTMVIVDSQFLNGSGGSPRGGALRIQGEFSLVINNTKFSDQITNEAGGALALEPSLVCADCITTIHNSVFYNNAVTGSGAHIYANGPMQLTVHNTSITRGSCVTGGVFANSLESVTVTDSYLSATAVAGGFLLAKTVPALHVSNCVFEDLTTSAIVMQSGTDDANITRCTFTGIAAGKGGAVDAASSARLTVSQCTMTQSSMSSSGTVYLFVVPDVTVSDCTFSDLTSGLGTGIVATGCDRLSVVRTSFTRCDATSDNGGAVDIVTATGATVLNSTFVDCSAGSFGGAVAFLQVSSVTVTNCVLVGNTARRGGGLYFDSFSSGSLTTNVTVTDGTAVLAGAGIIYGPACADHHVVGSYFARNLASQGAHVAFQAITSASVVDSVFIDGTATVTASTLIASKGSHNVTFSGLLVVGGSAPTATVALSEVTGFSRVTNCIFENNSADSAGALGADGCESLVVDECVFNGNSIGSSGGAFYVVDTPTTLTNSYFYGNAATLGGAISASLSTLSIGNCVFNNNTASTLGGTMLLFASPTTLAATSIVGASEEAVYVFFCDYFTAVNSSVSHSGSGSALTLNSVEAATLVSTTVTAFYTGSDSVQALDVAATALTLTSSFVGTDAPIAPALLSRDSTLVFNSGVACSQLAGLSAQCARTTVSGDFSSCNQIGTCRDACAATGFCVPSSGNPTVPNFGCNTCDGDCVRGLQTCSNISYCSDAVGGGAVCTCVSGYDGLSPNCTDVDECAIDNGGCVDTCVNTAGSFLCECSAGFTEGNGGVCVDVNECQTGSPCTLPRVCVNNIGSFTCVCGPDSLTIAATGACVYRCPPGTYKLGSMCFSCPPTLVSTFYNATACVGCPLGKEANEAQSGCVCEPGYQTINGSCYTDCSLGRRLVEANLGCVDCGIGFYGTFPGKCAACPGALSTTTVSNATSVSECVCQPDTIRDPEGGGDCLRICPPGATRDPAEGECVPCPANTYQPYLSHNASCTPCPARGMLTPSFGTISSTNCSCESGFQPEINSEDGGSGYLVCAVQCVPGQSRASVTSECEACGGGTYSTTANALECSDCPANTRSTSGSTKRTDCECSPGFYVRSGKKGVACTRCPSGGKCKGGTAAPVAVPGYAPIGGGDGGRVDSFIECTPRIACAGAGKCNTGYVGDRCASCESGFYRVGGYCQRCGAGPALGLAAGVAGVLVFCGALLSFNLREQSLSHATTAVIGANAVQVVAMFGRLDINWPYSVQAVFDALSTLSFNVELMGLECYAQGGSETNNPFFLRFLFTMCLPLVLLAGLGLAACAVVAAARLSLCGSASPVTATDIKRSFWQSTVQAALFLYLPLASGVFEFFDCVPSGVGDETVVAVARDVVCGSADWKRYRGAAIFFAALYPAAIPLCFGCGLAFARRKYSELDFAVRFGFLTHRYSPHMYFYEMAVLLRKLVVATTLTFITASAYIQAGATFAVLLFTFGLHSATEPYAFERHNFLESATLVAVNSVLMSGVMFQDNTLGTGTKTAFMFVLLLALVVVIGCGMGYDLYLLRRDSDSALAGADGVVDKAANRRSARNSKLDTAFAGADLDLDADGRDSEGKTYRVVAVESAVLQRDTGKRGVDQWDAFSGDAGGLSRVEFCQDYSSLQYFVRGVSGVASFRGGSGIGSGEGGSGGGGGGQPGERELFEYTITVETKYEVVGLRTHEIHLSGSTRVAITFTDVAAAYAFVRVVKKALPPALGMLSGHELYNDGVSVSSSDTSSATVSTLDPRAREKCAVTLEEAKRIMTDCLSAAAAAGLPLARVEESELSFVRNIGEGGFGAVKLFTFTPSGVEGAVGTPVALKVNTHSAETKSFVEEAVVLAGLLDNPRAVDFYGVCPELLAFATEFMSGGDVKGALKSNPAMYSYTDRLAILYESAVGLEALHARGLAHRDVKPANILLGSINTATTTTINSNDNSTTSTTATTLVKLGDFGLTSAESDPKYGHTVRYAAPEQLFEGQPGSCAADVYAFGATILEVITGVAPFTGYSRCDPVGNPTTPLRRGTADYDPHGYLGEELCRVFAAFVEDGCWATDPGVRPTMRDTVCLLASVLRKVLGVPVGGNGASQLSPTTAATTTAATPTAAAAVECKIALDTTALCAWGECEYTPPDAECQSTDLSYVNTLNGSRIASAIPTLRGSVGGGYRGALSGGGDDATTRESLVLSGGHVVGGVNDVTERPRSRIVSGPVASDRGFVDVTVLGGDSVGQRERGGSSLASVSNDPTVRGSSGRGSGTYAPYVAPRRAGGGVRSGVNVSDVTVFGGGGAGAGGTTSGSGDAAFDQTVFGARATASGDSGSGSGGMGVYSSSGKSGKSGSAAAAAASLYGVEFGRDDVTRLH